MFESDLSSNPFNLRLMQRCPVCHAEQASTNVEILEEVGSSFLAYLSCVKCGAALIVRVVTLPQGLVGNAILTDLLADEVVKFTSTEPVGVDEVLETWQGLTDPLWLTRLQRS